MTAPASSTPIRKAPLFTPYVVVWSMFGMLSLGLLGVIGLAPEWLDDLKPTWTVADPHSNQGQRAAARLAADLNAVKDSVAKIQFDLAKVKTDVASQSDQNKTVSAQVTALEQRVSTSSTVAKSGLPAVPAPPAATPEQQAQAATDVQSTVAQATVAQATVVTSMPPTTPALTAPNLTTPAPARTPKVINADAAAAPPAPAIKNGSALETGSVNGAAKAPADAISFGPAVVKAAPQPMGVKISSGASADSLRLSWSLLAEKHGDALKGLQARYVTGGDAQNPNYDLVAGPIKSKAEAAKVCKALSAKGVPCTVGAFGGDAL